MSGPLTGANPARMPKVAEIVLKAKLADELQMKSALRELEKWGGRITRIFNDMKFISEEKVVQALSHALKLPAVNLDTIPKDQAALNKLEAAFCEEKGIFPCSLKDQGKTLWLAMADPTDFAAVEDIERRLRVRTQLLVAGEINIKRAIARHYRGITDERQINTSGGLAAASADHLEFDGGPMTTGEFVDAKGDIVGKMKHVTNPRAAMPAPAAGRNLGTAESPSALTEFDALASAASQASGSVADELDHLFGMGPSKPQWSKEDLARLQAAQVNQEKGLRIFRAVVELLSEKQIFNQDDVAKLRG